MNINSNAVDTGLLQAILDRKLLSLMEKLSIEQLKKLLDKLTTPEFGTKGNYNVFCKHCSGSWQFETKEEARFFERFHKYSGCATIQEDYTKKKYITIGNRKVISDIAKGTVKKRSEHNVSAYANDFLIRHISKIEKQEKEKANASTKQPVETSVSEEQEVVPS